MAVTIDGSQGNFTTLSTPLTISLSTSKTNDIIVVACHAERSSTPHASISSISDTAGLSWAKRSSVALDNAGDGNAYNHGEIWWALSPGALSNDTITITFDRSVGSATAIAFGVNGANTSSPWDADVSLPATATSSSGAVPSISSITTDNGAIIIAAAFSANTGNSFPAGVIGGKTASKIFLDERGGAASITGLEYAAMSAAQSGISASFGSSVSSWLMIVDAIDAAHVPVVYNDSFTEIASASDSLANTMTMAATISESAAATDRQTNGSVFNDTISESAIASDAMAVAVTKNGWTSVPPETGGWSTVARPSGTWTKINPPGGSWTKH